MRNEIFSRINKNKIQFYAELKNGHSKITVDKNLCPDDSKIDTTIKVKKDHVTFLKSSLFIKRQLSICIDYVTFHTRNINKYLTDKVGIQSSRFTEGLSRISSQLFEDQYEYQEQTETDNGIDKFSSILELRPSSGATLSIPYDRINSSLANQITAWFNKVFRNIMLYLDSDIWFDEINQSHKSTQEQGVKKEYYNQSKATSKLKLLFISLRYKIEENKFKHHHNRVNIKIGHYYYVKIKTRIHTIATSLFPAINRFI